MAATSAELHADPDGADGDPLEGIRENVEHLAEGDFAISPVAEHLLEAFPLEDE